VTGAEAIAPDDLDLAASPRVAAGTTALLVGEETVLLGELGFAHVLNPTATLVWRFLDGQATLAELADDFAEALGADRTTVEEDLVEFARTLGRVGLLEGVAEPIDPGLEVEWPAAVALEPGEELVGFTFRDQDGEERALDAWRGGRVLLVNWSPGCGFCVQIAATLAEAEPDLAQEGVTLVFLTSGGRDDNARVFAEAGLAAPVLLKDGEPDPFDGFGTPSAYLLDADGRVAAPLVVGAFEVPRLVAELTGRDLAGGPTPDAEAEPPTGIQYLPAPGAACGPGGGAGASRAEDWAGTRALRIGDVHVGVGYDTVATAELLDRLLPTLGVTDRRVPDNYSVALDRVGTGAAQKLNLLVQGGRQLVRSRSKGRVLAGLLAHLSAATETLEVPDGLLALMVSVGMRDGRALLLPADLTPWIRDLQPRLHRLHIALVDGPITFLDPDAREVVVPEPSVAYEPEILDGADDGLRLGRELPRVRPGRYPLTDWYLPSAEDATGAWSPAQAVAAAYRQVAGVDGPEALGNQLAHLFAGVQATGVWLTSPKALVEQLTATRPDH
jgi:thiol-disulfide isomerase/thioredoxin